MNLQSQTTNSIKWSFLAEVTTRLITPIVFLVTRKYIKPEDFGLFLYATIFISLSQIFWGAGLAKVLIQRQEKIQESANVIFWTNAFLGLIIFVIMFFISPLIAENYQGDYRKETIFCVI